MKPKYSVYSSTFRPADGMQDNDIKVITDQLKSLCDYYHVITEKKDIQRHVHAIFFLKKDMNTSAYGQLWTRKFQYIFDEKRGMRKYFHVSKPCYNDDWCTNYLDKDDDTVVICSNLPTKDKREEYYKDIHVEDRRSGNAADPYFAKLKKLWEEEELLGWKEIETPFGTQRVRVKLNQPLMAKCLAKWMYVDKVLRCIPDERRIRRVGKTAVCYINSEMDIRWEINGDGNEGNAYKPPGREGYCESCRKSIFKNVESHM